MVNIKEGLSQESEQRGSLKEVFSILDRGALMAQGMGYSNEPVSMSFLSQYQSISDAESAKRALQEIGYDDVVVKGNSISLSADFSWSEAQELAKQSVMLANILRRIVEEEKD